MWCNWDKHLRGKFDALSYLQVIEFESFQNNFKTSLTSKFARQRYLYVSLISSAIGPPGVLQQRYSAPWLVFLILLGHFSSPLLSELMHTSLWVPWQGLVGSKSGCQIWMSEFFSLTTNPRALSGETQPPSSPPASLDTVSIMKEPL